MVCGHRILSPRGIMGTNIIYIHIGRILRWLPYSHLLMYAHLLSFIQSNTNLGVALEGF